MWRAKNLKRCQLKMFCFLKWTFSLLLLSGTANLQRACPRQEAILPCRCLIRGENYQIWCSHSDLPRVLDGLKTVGQYIKDPIDELILENNFLPSLPGRTFSPLKILRLMLRYNGLERVSSDFLSELEPNLLEIFIVEPQLRSLPEDALSKLNSLQAVTIQSNLLKRLPIFSGLPKLRYIQVESDSLLELSPMNFKNNLLLEKLHINRSPRLTRLEANLFSNLPSLKLLNISYCGVNLIHPRAINSLPLLNELWLMGNKIIDAGMIGRNSHDLPQLEIIRLDHNYIDKINEENFVNFPALKKIYLSNNRITELHHWAFHIVPSLTTLKLNKNMLKRLHHDSFSLHSGNGLEELWLIENDISHVAELRSILSVLPSLTFLDMSFNNLDTVPFGALPGHPTLEHLNLNHNKLHLIDREAFMAMPALTELRLKNNSLSDILEPPLWNLPALKGLDLSGNRFKRLDPKFFENISSLRRIDLNSNELGVVDPMLFLPTPSLEHINMSHNYINVLHPATFKHLLNLYELDISYNNLLEFVPVLPKGIEYLRLHHNKISEFPRVLAGLDLPTLRVLDLSFNRITYLPRDSFRALPQLKHLFLGKNSIQKLDESCFNGLNHLEILDIKDNGLVQIHSLLFRDLVELRELKIRNNRIDILVQDAFKTNIHLKHLDLSRNELVEIIPATFEKNLDLQYIDASYNALVQLPFAFFGLKNLRMLDLTNNRIKTINPEIFGSLINLRDLKLTKNFVHELRQGAFNNMPHLQTIHLNNNELEFIEPNAIRSIPFLKFVKFSQNKIKEIPNMAFNNLPFLQKIELQENDIRNIAPNAFNLVPDLLFLNLSNNQLIDLEEAGLHSLRSLELLDVSNNRISKVASPALEKLEWLVEIRMDNNNICGVKGSGFNVMPRLRLLSLRNNKMMFFPEHAIQRLRGNLAILDIDGNPLACACNMLWLQAWLQESSRRGPHCLDGTLLRDMRLSRQNCLDENQNINMVAPGCEAELLTAPGLLGTSQVFSQWNKKSFQNVTKDNLKTQNMVQSPEESDYFYDEYVDYPYNESLVDKIDLNNDKVTDKEVISTSIPLITTKSPHYTAGDTPTIYAASKQKPKPDIPPTINNSPSTSGFTFFGIPLSNLNLNQLLKGGTSRMENKNSAKITAERKTAIINKVAKSPKLPVNMQLPNLPRMMNMQPPTKPEIHTGFLPLLPGDGGFKPILNPHIHRPTLFTNTINKTPLESVTQATNTRSELIKSTNITQEKNPNRLLNSSEKPNLYFYIAQENNPYPTNTPTITKENNYTLHAMNINEKYNQKLLHSVTATTEKASTEIRKNLQSKIHIQSENVSNEYIETISVFVDEITTEKAQNTILPLVTNVSVSTDRTIDILSEPIDDTIITTEISNINDLETTITTSKPIKRNEEALVERITGTPVPTLLIPAQQFKHSGRSTVTKVTSPHVSSNSPIQASLEVSRDSELLSQRGILKSHDYSLNTPEKSVEDTNWYFANYNKTNLEPYIARIADTNRGICIFVHNDFWKLFLVIQSLLQIYVNKYKCEIGQIITST